MTREEALLLGEAADKQYAYRELMATFLAGSRMASEHHSSWREAFEKWLITLLENRKSDLDLP